MHRVRPLPVLVMLAATGCAPEPSYTTHLPATICQSGQAVDLVGHNIGEYTFPPSLRHVIVSKDLEPLPNDGTALLTIHVDDKGWISRASCE